MTYLSKAKLCFFICQAMIAWLLFLFMAAQHPHWAITLLLVSGIVFYLRLQKSFIDMIKLEGESDEDYR
jgi:hypothetical protein